MSSGAGGPAAHYANNTKGNMFHLSVCPAAVFPVCVCVCVCGGGEDPVKQTKAVKKNMPVISHRAPAERSHITLIYMCVTFMSFTMAWNNPPSAPHSFSTDSMVSNNQTKQKKLAERLSGKTKSDQISASLRIRRGELWGFLILFIRPSSSSLSPEKKQRR